MQCKKYLILIWVLIIQLSVSGQCLFGDALWNRINQLASLNISTDSQLNELLSLNVRLKVCRAFRDSSDAFLLQRIGVMYFNKSDFQSSVGYTLKSLDILNELQRKSYINPKQKWKCYRNLSFYYGSLGMIDKRMEAIDSCISISQNSRIIDSIVLYPFGDKIEYLQNIGDYARCIGYARLSQNFADKYGYKGTNIIKWIFTWKINALLFLKNYTSVVSELKNKEKEYEHFPIDDNVGNLWQLWATYYLDIGKIDSALSSCNKSYQIYLATKYTAGCASILNDIGFIYSKNLMDYSKALNYYFKALTFNDARGSLSTLTNIGNLYVKKHKFDSAFYYYQNAFNQVSPGLDENGLLSIKNIQSYGSATEYLGTLVLDKADAQLSQYKVTLNENQLNHTLAFYRKADQVMDKIKDDQYEVQSKLSWRKSVRRLYEHAIEASWLAKNHEQGFYFFEKSRAVLLDDQLKEDQSMQRLELIDQYQLKSRINYLENQLDTANPHSDNYSVVQAEIIKKKEEQDRLLTGIKTKDPLYFARNSNAESMSIQDVQSSILKDHTALIEIFNGDSSVYILTITNSGSNISKLDKGSYDSLTQNYISFISNPDLLNTQFPAFTNISEKLYKMIINNHSLPAGRIIVSPDGPCFPFEALITNKEPEIHYMLEDYSISYTYSARFLLSHFASTTDRPFNDFMGIAPVQFASYMKLSSLPGSDISLDRIITHFRNVFIEKNDEASKSNFLLNFPKYKIVQIYSHASYSSSNEKPLVYFSDSSMNLSELFSEVRPAARLVVLSACETALGRDYKGEGVFSFSREFAGLGIPATISNLWSVDNESTYRITELFYELLSKGLPTDEALQQAKLIFIKEGSKEKGLPYYWASPILTGKTEIIKTKSAFPVWKVVLLLSIAGLLLWLGIKKQQ